MDVLSVRHIMQKVYEGRIVLQRATSMQPPQIETWINPITAKVLWFSYFGKFQKTSAIQTIYLRFAFADAGKFESGSEKDR